VHKQAVQQCRQHSQESSSLASANTNGQQMDIVKTHAKDNKSTNQKISSPATDAHFLILPAFRTYEAFDCIYSILRLECSYTVAIHVPQSIQAPNPLKPIWEQLNIPHMMFIDLLPWPSLRRNLILANGIMDDHGFMTDMNSDKLRVWGTIPWDPMGWEVSEEFLTKWWFLLDENILRVTNFWRRQRKESELTFPEHSLTGQKHEGFLMLPDISRNEGETSEKDSHSKP
jgi:hypothetical protein